MQMKKTQTFPPTKRAIPIVGWYRFCGEFTPPAREIDFLYYGSKEVEYVLVDIPEERVMLSDAFAWNSIMLGEYYAGYRSREDQRKKLEHFKNLDIFEQAFTVMRNLLSGIISVGIASLIILVSILTRILPTFFDIHRVF